MITTSNGMTVLQALAMAQDATLNSVKSKAVIIRPDPKATEGHEQASGKSEPGARGQAARHCNGGG